MFSFNVGNKEYTLEYTFSASEHKETVQKIFNVVSGVYLINGMNESKKNEKKNNSAIYLINGTAEMVSDIPNIVKTCFYSGLLENHSVTELEADLIRKQYMRENKISYKKLFDDIKKCMEDDGFFDLSGLTEMMNEMNQNIREKILATQKK